MRIIIVCFNFLIFLVSIKVLQQDLIFVKKYFLIDIEVLYPNTVSPALETSKYYFFKD
jgi:hypothetical protein